MFWLVNVSMCISLILVFLLICLFLAMKKMKSANAAEPKRTINNPNAVNKCSKRKLKETTRRKLKNQQKCIEASKLETVTDSPSKRVCRLQPPINNDLRYQQNHKKNYQNIKHARSGSLNHQYKYIESPVGTNLNFESNKARPKGLKNFGNTCFLNTAIQCLSNIPDLRDFFLSESFINDYKNTNNIIDDSISKSFSDLMKYLWSNDQNEEAVLYLKNKIGVVSSKFQDFNQQDSREFLAYLLDGMHEELKSPTESKTNFDEILIESPEAFKEKLAHIKESYFENNFSKISELFHFIICMKNKCLNPDCSMISLKFDMASFLVVPILNDKTGIEDCLRPIFERKQCNEYFCSNCKCKERKSREEFILCTFPPVLVLQLRRFEFSVYGMKKNESFLNFKTELDFNNIIDHKLLNDKLPSYKLVSVSNHSGSIHGGHYYTYAFNDRYEKWYELNDNWVAEMDENKICTRNAYYLIYTKNHQLQR